MMDELLDAPTQEVSEKEQEQEAEPWSDPDLLSYLDKLCSEEDFVTKVVIMEELRWSRHMNDPLFCVF